MGKANIGPKTSAEWQYYLEDVFDDYAEYLMALNRSSKTISGYLDSLREYSRFLKDNSLYQPVSDLGKAELTSYIIFLRDRHRWYGEKGSSIHKNVKLSSHTIRAYVRDIKVFWSWLAKQGYTKVNRLAGFPLPKVAKTIMPTLSPEQIARLLATLDKDTPQGFRNYIIVIIFYDTAIRLSELTGLKLADIDMQHKLVKVHGKGQKERLVPISTATRKLLVKYLGYIRPKLCNVESHYVFPRQDGEGLSGSAVQQLLRRLARKCGLTDIQCSPHVFRHSSATAAIINGANLETLRTILGHTSIITTSRYTHLGPSEVQKQHSSFSPINNILT